jgi:spore coat protein H
MSLGTVSYCRARRMVKTALLAAALAGCGGGTPPPGDGEPAPPPPMVGWGNASVLGGGGVLQYAFTVDPAALAQLSATALAEKYVPAALTVSGEDLGMVGLRFKGDAGTLDPCFANGVQVCPKVSFKVKFDQVDPGKRFHSLQKLNFHSMIDDPSLLHERLNAKLFADMGLVAPRVSHAEITVNGENKGIFAAVEEVDLTFLQDRFKPGGAGNLYKEAWPNDVEPDAYDPTLETNQNVRDHSGIISFAQGLRTAGPADLAGVLNHFTDVDYLIRYLAVDRAIGNYDGFTAFYCDDVGHECSNHNFYWYQAESQARFWLIPWDLGDSLSLHSPLEVVPDWDNPPADCTLRFRVEGSVVMPPGCDVVFKAIRAVGRPTYLNAINRLLGVWDMGALYRQIDAWTAEIADAVARDTTLPSGAAWRTAVRSLKRDLGALRERVEKNRDGMTAAPFGLAAPGLTDFESSTPLTFLLSTSSESNLKSSAYHDLNRRAALGGNADARLEFELRNDSNDPNAGAFSQWAVMRLPLEKQTSLVGLKRIRLRVRADNIRNVRVELSSPAYGDEAADRYGWSLLGGQAIDSGVLELGQLALPDGSRGPTLGAVLNSVDGLIISPEARGRSDSGLLPAGKADTGFIQIDDISIELE